MAWINWSFHPIDRRVTLGIVGYRPARGDDDNHMVLLLADDEWGVSEDKTRQYCETFLALKSGATPVDDGIHVKVYFVSNFELEKDLLADPRKYDFDGILQDLRMHREDDNLPGELNLEQLRQLGATPRSGVLILSEHSDNRVFERAKAGLANRFALKKGEPAERTHGQEKILRDFFRYVELRRFMRTSPMRDELKKFVGVSTLYHIVDFLKLLANDRPNHRLPIIILGPTGCGKEHVARLIHAMDCIGRSKPVNYEKFSPVLFGAIAEGVMEGEIFGVDKLYDRMPPIPGYIRDAKEGTVFFDEVGDIPLNIQGKMLRFLQEGEVHPIGGKWEKVDDVRVVFATHKDLLKHFQDGILREDFIHRIDGLTIRLPSLAERLDEHQLLIDHFFIDASIKEMTGRPIQEAVQPDLNEHLLKLCREGAFTGNVRQLSSFIKRLVRFATRNNPVGMYEYHLAVEHSLMPPGYSQGQGKPLEEEAAHPLEAAFGDMAWNAFIQSEHWVKGKCMKSADEKGFKTKEIVEFLMSREATDILTDTEGTTIEAPDRDELQKRLTSLYQRSKENWIASFEQSQKG